ncbi:hypothetical protein [Streptomyces sp. NBC_01092]|uniref:hypothetical protein n=1 Tax=Streptomyces sp. NBC_01092 TaxID=2903748 RepID=UPI00386B664E|nr:hypothetical protein OG254_38115 [Streptomyces sp. NBC_01092]
MPRVKMSAAEWSAKGRQAVALRYGRPEEAHRAGVDLLRARAETLTTEAERLRAEADELEKTGPAL